MNPLGLQGKTAPRPTSSLRRIYRCSRCGRRLKQDRWVYSKHTHKRYCWPGEGCFR